jgi:hypothetical protein
MPSQHRSNRTVHKDFAKAAVPSGLKCQPKSTWSKYGQGVHPLCHFPLLDKFLPLPQRKHRCTLCGLTLGDLDGCISHVMQKHPKHLGHLAAQIGEHTTINGAGVVYEAQKYCQESPAHKCVICGDVFLNLEEAVIHATGSHVDKLNASAADAEVVSTDLLVPVPLPPLKPEQTGYDTRAAELEKERFRKEFEAAGRDARMTYARSKGVSGYRLISHHAHEVVQEAKPVKLPIAMKHVSDLSPKKRLEHAENSPHKRDRSLPALLEPDLPELVARDSQPKKHGKLLAKRKTGAKRDRQSLPALAPKTTALPEIVAPEGGRFGVNVAPEGGRFGVNVAPDSVRTRLPNPTMDIKTGYRMQDFALSSLGPEPMSPGSPTFQKGRKNSQLGLFQMKLLTYDGKEF